MNMQEKVYLMCCSDEAYVKYASVTILSVQKYTTCTIECFFITPKPLSPKVRKKLESLSNPSFVLHIIVCEETPFLHLPSLGGSFSTYLRLLLGEFLPSYVEKICYIDCDVLVLADIQELYRIDLGDKLLGAVRDIAYQEPSSVCPNHLGFYFNAGVELINVSLWRKSGAWERLSECIKHKSYVAKGYHDQNCLNFCFWDEVLEFPLEWNMIYLAPFLLSFDEESPLEDSHLQDTHLQENLPKESQDLWSVEALFEKQRLSSRHTKAVYERALAKPKIVHFASIPKPWQRVCYIREYLSHPVLVSIENPYAKLWRKMAKKSPFYKEIRAVYMPYVYAECKTRFVYVLKRFCPRLYAFCIGVLRSVRG